MTLLLHGGDAAMVEKASAAAPASSTALTDDHAMNGCPDGSGPAWPSWPSRLIASWPAANAQARASQPADPPPDGRSERERRRDQQGGADRVVRPSPGCRPSVPARRHQLERQHRRARRSARTDADAKRPGHGPAVAGSSPAAAGPRRSAPRRRRSPSAGRRSRWRRRPC